MRRIDDQEAYYLQVFQDFTINRKESVEVIVNSFV